MGWELCVNGKTGYEEQELIWNNGCWFPSLGVAELVFPCFSTLVAVS